MAKGQSNYSNSLNNSAGTGPVQAQPPSASGGFQMPISGTSTGGNGLMNRLFPGYSGTPAQVPFASAPVSTPPSPMTFDGGPAMVPTTGAGAGPQAPTQRYTAY